MSPTSPLSPLKRSVTSVFKHLSKHTGEAMTEEEINRHWEAIINTMNDGLALIGTDGQILMVNRALEEMTGYSRDEMVGNSCSLFNCDTCERARSRGGRNVWCSVFAQGHLRHRRCVVMRKDGSYFHAVKNASLLHTPEGEPMAAVETFTDISELDKKEREILQLSRLLHVKNGFQGMVGESPAMLRVYEITEKAAKSDAPVIIFGESGTGKELVARALHQLGRRAEGPYIQLNCAALNESLLESELFGHVKGAFTGALSHRQGRFEAANGGDIFLDEIGDIPLAIQVKLLRVLETKRFERVGDHRPISVDVRIITATNRNLEDLIAQGKFREDFYFRINVIPIHLPPLRERMEDIPLLVDAFVQRLAQKSGKPITGVSAATMNRFMDYHWPGNIRELKSALEFAFVIAEKGLIETSHLPGKITGAGPIPEACSGPVTFLNGDEKTQLITALRQAGGNQTRAARLLGVSRVTVWHRMKKHGIDLKKVIG